MFELEKKETWKKKMKKRGIIKSDYDVDDRLIVF